jgi:hypothetical protein
MVNGHLLGLAAVTYISLPPLYVRDILFLKSIITAQSKLAEKDPSFGVSTQAVEYIPLPPPGLFQHFPLS